MAITNLASFTSFSMVSRYYAFEVLLSKFMIVKPTPKKRQNKHIKMEKRRKKLEKKNMNIGQFPILKLLFNFHAQLFEIEN